MSKRTGLSFVSGILLGLIVLLAGFALVLGWFTNVTHRVALVRPDLQSVQVYDSLGDKYLFLATIQVGQGNYPDYQEQLFELEDLTVTQVFPNPVALEHMPCCHAIVWPDKARYLPDGSIAYTVSWWTIGHNGGPGVTWSTVLFWEKDDVLTEVGKISGDQPLPIIGWDGQKPVLK